MLADVAIACTLMVPILGLALGLGVRLQSGPAGVLVFLLMGCAVEPGIRRVRLRHRPEDRQPCRGQLQLPAVLPVPVHDLLLRPPRAAERMAGHASPRWNPVTYVLEGLRSLVTQGWQWDSLGKAVLAIIAVGLVSMSLCLAALRGRTRRG